MLQDVVDSDFDEDEMAQDSEKEADSAEREARRAERVRGQKGRTGRYVDPGVKKAKQASDGGEGGAKKRARRDSNKASSSGGLDRSSLRKSTRVASARAAERRAIRESRKPRERRVEQFVVPTQEERLLAAEETERENRESLKRLLRVEEEKKGVVVQRDAVNGERMGLLWRDGECCVSFTNGVSEEQIRDVMFGKGLDG